MSTQPIPNLSPEQYLEIERNAEFRSEYLNGQMFAMSGGTINHARIIKNTLLRLDEQLRGKPCEAVASDLRLFGERYRVFTYPDIVVACGTLRFHDERKDTIIDATLVIEVLSPSTSNYDRGEKFVFYQSLPSFREYLLLAQNAVRAEHHALQPDGCWLLRQFSSPDDEIGLESIDCSLRLGSLYDRVDF
ncbi:MAG: Uma2 family endonuclease [Bryobacteraceae bacterium]